jgi:Flp pilus assembly pilin Flp
VLTYLPATLMYVRARLGELRADEQGVTAVEYALMVAIIAVLLVGAFYTLFDRVYQRYGNVSECVSSGPLPAVCSPSPPAEPES